MSENELFSDESGKNFPDLTPLIDVIFILIVFFLLTPSMNEKLLEINLPSAGAAEDAAQPDNPVFEIDRSDNIYWKGRIIDLTEIPALLKGHGFRADEGRLGGKGSRTIGIRSDRGSSFGTVVNLMDSVRQAGFYDISFYVEEEKGNAENLSGRPAQ